MNNKKTRTLGEYINNSAEILDIHKAVDALRFAKKNGVPKGLSTGWREFDKYFTFPPTGQLNVVTGAPSSGKSEWVDSLALNMAVLHGWKIFNYSPENFPAEYHLQKLVEKYTGKPFDFCFNGYENVTMDEIDKFEKFLLEHYGFINCHINNASIDSILDAIFLECRSKRVNMVIIDPWNKLDSQRAKNESETDFIGRTLTRIQMFSRQNNIAFFIVAHPSKPPANNPNKVPTLYDISGSQHWRNMVDNGFVLHRSWKDKIDGRFMTRMQIAKIKDRRYGKFGEMDFQFNPANGRYWSVDTNGKASDNEQRELAF